MNYTKYSCCLGKKNISAEFRILENNTGRVCFYNLDTDEYNESLEESFSSEKDFWQKINDLKEEGYKVRNEHPKQSNRQLFSD